MQQLAKIHWNMQWKSVKAKTNETRQKTSKHGKPPKQGQKAKRP